MSRYSGIHDAEDAMAVIRDAMYGKDIDIIARRVGVSVSCIRRIRSGTTKWPRPATFFTLLVILDLEMIIRPRTS